MLERREVHFTGHVQGVGFRYQTLQIARGYDVIGTVKNLADGRVQLIVQGSPEELDAFLAEIESALDGFIRSTDSKQLEPLGDLKTFSILP
ncbi:MAG: acylphosphatase [Puniceicoccaceae bacterium]